MQKHYNERSTTHYEYMPKDLIDMCLECKRPHCPGRCQQYEEREREYNKNSSMTRNNGLYKKRGVAAQRYPFSGGKISAPEMAELIGIHRTSVRRHLKMGKTMEEIYRMYVHEIGP